MYELYKDANQDWRWRYVTNGRTIADSGEGYRNLADAKRGIEIMKSSGGSQVQDLTRGLLGGSIVRGGLLPE